MPYEDLIEKHARRVGIDPQWMKSIMRVESGGQAGAQTGSYKGLYQLSSREFKAHGGSGDIFDPEQNTMAAANKLAKESLAFKEKTGREPKLIDLYMIHQQGEAGYSAHLAKPDAPAWENVRKYYESDKIAKDAIWGNLPKSEKARLGSVENVTSKDLVSAWDDSIKGGGAEYGGTAVASSGEASEAKMAFMEGKDTPQRKPTLMGMDFDVPQPRIDLKIPDFTPRFKTA